MVAKNPDSVDKVSGVVTSQSASRSSKHRRVRVWLSIFLILVCVAALSFVAIDVLRVGQKVYAEAAGHKIYKKDVEAIKAGDKSISDHDAATVLADKYLTEAMAKQYHVTVSKSDINASLDQISNPALPQDSKTQPSHYARQAAINQVYFTRLAANNAGIYKGKLLVANFSRDVPYQSSILSEKKALNPNLGNPAAIAADKKYALDFITSLYNQIKTKKITFDQAIQKEHSDPTVGEKAYPTQSHSGSFDGPLNQYGLLSAKSIRSKLKTMKLHQISAPFAVKTPDSDFNRSSTAATYYLVVRMDARSGGDIKMSFAKELAQAKKQLGYKVNV